MHIPDGFLNGTTAAVTGVLSAAALTMAVRQARVHLPRRKVPLMGLSAAFVFAAMMLNFPILGGTSGHMVGGVLCSVLLGPAAAILVISCVLILQCFVFADGGVLALGANIFNMAVVCSVGGYYIYRMVYAMLPNPRGRLVAIAFASWLATVLASIVCAGELALSGTIHWSVAFPAMAGVHMIVGVGEAIITTLVIFTILKVRPDLVEAGPIQGQPRHYGQILIFGILIALGLSIFVAPFAVPDWPDSIGYVAHKFGFEDREVKERSVSAPIPDYKVPGVSSEVIAIGLAGGIGTVGAFALAFVLARVLIPKNCAEPFASCHSGQEEQ